MMTTTKAPSVLDRIRARVAAQIKPDSENAITAIRQRVERERTPTETRRMSREAAEFKKEEFYRAILKALAIEPMTCDELAFELDESILSVRPRVSELFRDLAKIEPTGEKRATPSGKSSAVWRIKL